MSNRVEGFEKQESIVLGLIQSLNKLIGLHRQLKDLVREEREALTQVSLKKIHEIAYQKEVCVGLVNQEEVHRRFLTAELAKLMGVTGDSFSLSTVILWVQDFSHEHSNQLQKQQNTLKILLDRIFEQNSYNKSLLDKSLEHVQNMRKNVLGENNPKAAVYNAHAQKTNNSQEARFLSREA